MTQVQGQTLQENVRIGVYEIKDVMHVGEFNIIYRAWNHHLNAPQVLKEYFPQRLAARAKDRQTVAAKSDSDKTIYEVGLEYFIEQAELLTEIDHINLMRVYNLLEFNGTAYQVMDYEDAKPLSNLAVRPSGAQLQAILLALLGGLQELHTRNTVHGAIHPGNVLVRANGDPVLTGFAADRLAVEAWHYQVLHEGFSPAEQYESGDRMQCASDFYALGATMYSCIAGAPPVPACYRELAISRSQADPLRPFFRGANPEFSEQLLQTVEWMLDPEYEKRPDSARVAIAALKADLKNGVISGKPDKRNNSEPNQNKSGLIGQPRVMLWVGGFAAVVAFAVTGLILILSDEQPAESLAANRQIETELIVDKNSVKQLVKSSDQHKNPVGGALRDPRNRERKGGDPKTSETEGLQARATQLPARVKVAAKKTAVRKTPDRMPSVETAMFDTDPEPGAGPANLSTPEQPTTRIAKRGGAAVSKSKDSAILAKEHWIDGQLTAAKSDLDALRLTTPPRANALTRYRAILAVEPDNTAALNGVRHIIERYVLLIENAKQQGNLRAVKLYLKRVESVLPSVAKKKNRRID